MGTVLWYLTNLPPHWVAIRAQHVLDFYLFLGIRPSWKISRTERLNFAASFYQSIATVISPSRLVHETKCKITV